jgi:hypothetical protein
VVAVVSFVLLNLREVFEGAGLILNSCVEGLFVTACLNIYQISGTFNINFTCVDFV